MRYQTRTVFSDFVVGTTTVYTSNEHNGTIGSTDKIAFHVISDQVSGTSPTLTLQIEHSGDGRNWLNKAGTAEINAVALSTSATNINFASDNGSTPSLGFMRFRITLGGTSPVAHIKVNVVGRDNGAMK